jgi:hypothetical protein
LTQPSSTLIDTSNIDTTNTNNCDEISKINSIDKTNTNSSNGISNNNTIDTANANKSDNSSMFNISSQLLAHEYALVNPNGANILSEMETVSGNDFDLNDIMHLVDPYFYDYDHLTIKPNEISGKKNIYILSCNFYSK